MRRHSAAISMFSSFLFPGTRFPIHVRIMLRKVAARPFLEFHFPEFIIQVRAHLSLNVFFEMKSEPNSCRILERLTVNFRHYHTRTECRTLSHMSSFLVTRRDRFIQTSAIHGQRSTLFPCRRYYQIMTQIGNTDHLHSQIDCYQDMYVFTVRHIQRVGQSQFYPFSSDVSCSGPNLWNFPFFNEICQRWSISTL